MTKVKTQNKSIKKRSIADDFGLHANNFSLLHSPGRQLCPYGKELFGANLISNGDFRDFTMEDDANTIGHYIFDKSYEREDKNKYIGSERGGEETVHYQSDFSTGQDGWHIHYIGIGQTATASWNSSLPALNLSVTVNGTTSWRPSWIRIIPVVEDGADYELVINCIINSGTFIIGSHLLGGGWTDIPDWTLTTGENRRVITANGTSGSWALYTDGLNHLYNIDITSVELRKLPAKSLLPAGFSHDFEDEFHLPGYSPNRIVNGGTPETTDWVDTNEDGLADSWSWVSSYTGIPSIVTGNGFSDNAQRGENAGTSSSILNTAGINGLKAGKKYKLSLKYRSNKTLYFKYYSGHACFSMPANTGNAVNWSGDFIHQGYNPQMYIGLLSVSSGDWFEIDEVEFVEVYRENPTYKNGGQLYFNGVDQYFGGGDINDLGNGAFTIEAWIKAADYTPSEYKVLISKYQDGSNKYVLFIAPSTGELTFFSEESDNLAYRGYTDISGLTNTIWHHIVFVVDPGISMQYYVDGETVTTTVIGNVQRNINNTGDFKIGSENSLYHWDGYISEVRISNVARTAQEIRDSYGAAKGTYSSDPTTYDVITENNDFTQKIIADGSTTWSRLLIPVSGLEVGSLYRLECTSHVATGDNDLSIQLAAAPIGTAWGYFLNEVKNQWVTQFIYIVPGATTGYLRLAVETIGDSGLFENLKLHKVSTPPISNFAENFSKGGAKYGNNLINNGNFLVGGTGWSSSGNGTANLDYADNECTVTVTSAGTVIITQSESITAGKLYYCTMTIRDYTASQPVTLSFYQSGVGNDAVISKSANGVYSTYFKAPKTVNTIYFGNAGVGYSLNDVFTVDDISVKEVSNGNHGLMQNDMENDQPTYPYALEYNGVDQSIKYGVINIDKDDPFILFAWIYINIDGTTRTILCNQDNAPTYRGFVFYIDVAEKLGAIFRSTTSNKLGKYVNTALSEGWHFVTVSYDGSLSASGMKLYLESVEITETTNVGDNLTDTTISSIPIYSGAREGIGNFHNNKIGDTGIILFDGNAGRPSSLPSNYVDWINRIYNATKWKYKN